MSDRPRGASSNRPVDASDRQRSSSPEGEQPTSFDASREKAHASYERTSAQEGSLSPLQKNLIESAHNFVSYQDAEAQVEQHQKMLESRMRLGVPVVDGQESTLRVVGLPSLRRDLGYGLDTALRRTSVSEHPQIIQKELQNIRKDLQTTKKQGFFGIRTIRLGSPTPESNRTYDLSLKLGAGPSTFRGTTGEVNRINNERRQEKRDLTYKLTRDGVNGLLRGASPKMINGFPVKSDTYQQAPDQES
jgi:hypothetical protein